MFTDHPDEKPEGIYPKESYLSFPLITTTQ
jgi:hypothetical protein